MATSESLPDAPSFASRAITHSVVVSTFAWVVWIGWHRFRSWNVRRRRKWSKYLPPFEKKDDDNGQQSSEGPSSLPVTVVGFFHPYCSHGGGGERVLWKMIQVLLVGANSVNATNTTSRIHVVIYTVDEPTPTYKTDVLQKVEKRFGLRLPSVTAEHSLDFVHLHHYKHLLQPSPFLSLLIESLSTMVLAYRTLLLSLKLSSRTDKTGNRNLLLLPDIFVDTTGYAFSYVVANVVFGCTVCAYVHYPTISTDMLRLVWEQRRRGPGSETAAYGYEKAVPTRTLTAYLKLIYYVGFAILYGTAGGCFCRMAWVNSTWTYRHIQSLWKYAAWLSRIQILYPPCSLPEDDSKTNNTAKLVKRQNAIISIGQFRPEKDHALQIEAFAELLLRHPEYKEGKDNGSQLKLVIIGSCRNDQDEELLHSLRQLSQRLKVDEQVQFVVNQPFPVLLDWFSQARIGLHTMWNEHFGIGIVEMMMAGLVVVAHNSGGPKSDIVSPLTNGSNQTTDHGLPTNATGFLASTVNEYATVLHQALSFSEREEQQLRKQAQASAERFSDSVFEGNCRQSFITLLQSL